MRAKDAIEVANVLGQGDGTLLADVKRDGLKRADRIEKKEDKA